jgi:ABC-type Fe3+ transport system substrate-binding protein
MKRREFLKLVALSGASMATGEWLDPLGVRLQGAAAHMRVAQAAEAPMLQAITSQVEKQRIAALIDGARREGTINWVGVLVEPPHAEFLIAEFKRYCGLPDFKVNYTYTSPGETVTKVEETLRAGRRETDIIYNSAYAWFVDLLKRGEVMRYDSPEYRAFSISRREHMSKPGYWVSDSYSFHPMYNPSILAKRGVKDFRPTSWWDFVDPRLKGLMSVGDVLRNTSHAQVMQGLLKVLGRRFFEDLAKNVKPVTFSRSAQGRDWVASGEYPITLSSHAKNTQELRRKGILAKLIYPKEGIVLLPFTLVALTKAPHPNASQLFLEFMRSHHGGVTLLHAGTLQWMGRPDVPTPSPELLPPIEKIKTIPLEWETEGTEEAIRTVRNMWRDVGLS